ncbi:energy-coupling factor ABC transporter ATP-binding protein [Calorimonas adulescens]|nr:ABC transporter ATP-binding protein [Calorimonas adulescens]
MSEIEVRNLHFSYTKGQEVLAGITLDLNLRPTAIIGQNGAGKTTFVKLLKGLLKPTEGDIFVKGYNTKEKSVAFLARYIGLVFQNPNDQIFKSKLIDEVMFGPLNIGQDEKTAKRNSLEALDLVGLRNRINENPYDLSLSDRKLVSIASILAMDTDIIVFDEPTIAQDYRGKEKIKDIIRYLKDKGKLVITIIHDMDFVAETFERVIVFNRGKVLLDGDTRFVYSYRDKLRTASLEQPYVMQLAQKLDIEKPLLTVDEFTRWLNDR